MKVLGYSAPSATGALEPFVFERRAERPDDVVIDILYCGVCHTDLHLARNHFGFTSYPIVPGHEIIGKVRQVGEKVGRFKAGDMVGVGCLVDSCQHCKPCLKGWEQDCAEGATFTYASRDRHDGTVTHGGYSDSIVVCDKFVLALPDGLDPAGAAHGIVSDVEIIPIQQINEAYERMLKSDVKYRFVIDMASLKS